MYFYVQVITYLIVWIWKPVHILDVGMLHHPTTHNMVHRKSQLMTRCTPFVNFCFPCITYVHCVTDDMHRPLILIKGLDWFSGSYVSTCSHMNMRNYLIVWTWESLHTSQSRTHCIMFVHCIYSALHMCIMLQITYTVQYLLI